MNFAGEYREQVFAHFLDEHRKGRTPNPDVLCNREIKFGVMRAYAKRLGATAIATGPLRAASTPRRRRRRAQRRAAAPQGARRLQGPELLPARRRTRDDLRDVLFPLGDLLKSEVRDAARDAGLPVAEKKDSTGICFIGERPFAEFLRTTCRRRPGVIRDDDGRERGRHDGLAYYTLGQRHGLQHRRRRGRGEAAWYVARKDAERNELVVVQGHDHPLLLRGRARRGRRALDRRAAGRLDERPAVPLHG